MYSIIVRNAGRRSPKPKILIFTVKAVFGMTSSIIEMLCDMSIDTDAGLGIQSAEALILVMFLFLKGLVRQLCV